MAGSRKYRVEKAQASVILTGLTGAIIGCALNHTTRLPKKDADLREVAFTFMIQLKDTAMAVSKWKDASSMTLERLSKNRCSEAYVKYQIPTECKN